MSITDHLINKALDAADEQKDRAKSAFEQFADIFADDLEDDFEGADRVDLIEARAAKIANTPKP